MAHWLSCPVACGIFPDEESNLCPVHWQADSVPLDHQELADALAYCHEKKVIRCCWGSWVRWRCRLQLVCAHTLSKEKDDVWDAGLLAPRNDQGGNKQWEGGSMVPRGALLWASGGKSLWGCLPYWNLQTHPQGGCKIFCTNTFGDSGPDVQASQIPALGVAALGLGAAMGPGSLSEGAAPAAQMASLALPTPIPWWLLVEHLGSGIASVFCFFACGMHHAS